MKKEKRLLIMFVIGLSLISLAFSAQYEYEDCPEEMEAGAVHGNYYCVESGDSISYIYLTYVKEWTLDEFLEKNNIPKDKRNYIYIGQKLLISDKSIDGGISQEKDEETKEASSDEGQYEYYIIQEGDTFIGVYNKYSHPRGYTYDQFLHWNRENLKDSDNPNLIYPDDKLIIAQRSIPAKPEEEQKQAFTHITGEEEAINAEFSTSGRAILEGFLRYLYQKEDIVVLVEIVDEVNETKRYLRMANTFASNKLDTIGNPETNMLIYYERSVNQVYFYGNINSHEIMDQVTLSDPLTFGHYIQITGLVLKYTQEKETTDEIALLLGEGASEEGGNTYIYEQEGRLFCQEEGYCDNRKCDVAIDITYKDAQACTDSLSKVCSDFQSGLCSELVSAQFGKISSRLFLENLNSILSKSPQHSYNIHWKPSGETMCLRSDEECEDCVKSEKKFTNKGDCMISLLGVCEGYLSISSDRPVCKQLLESKFSPLLLQGDKDEDRYDILIIAEDMTGPQVEKIFEGSFGDPSSNAFSLFATQPFEGKEDRFNFYYITVPLLPEDHRLSYENTIGKDWRDRMCEHSNGIVVSDYLWTIGKSYNEEFELIIYLSRDPGIWPSAWKGKDIQISKNCERVSDEESLQKTMVHEFGHAFLEFDDEYIVKDGEQKEFKYNCLENLDNIDNLPFDISEQEIEDYNMASINKGCNNEENYRLSYNSMMKSEWRILKNDWYYAWGPHSSYLIEQRFAQMEVQNYEIS